MEAKTRTGLSMRQALTPHKGRVDELGPQAPGPGFDTLVGQGSQPGDVAEYVRAIHESVQALRAEVRDQIPAAMPQSVRRAFARLVARGVERPLAREIAEAGWARVTTPRRLAPRGVWEGAREALAGVLRCCGGIRLSPGRCAVVALLGQTGVGKSLTAAKIARHTREGLGRTAITVGIGGGPSADAAARTPNALRDIVQANRDKDLLLIDTPGCGPHDTPRIDAVRRFLQSVGTHERIVVLPAGAQAEDMLTAVRVFSADPRDMLVFSKLDETTRQGAMVNLMTRVVNEIAYVTCGQKVPEDILVGDPADLAADILGPEPAGSRGRA